MASTIKRKPLGEAERSAAPVNARRKGAIVYCLALVLAVVITPLWIVRFPGMIDYPSHLVRCYILAHFGANPFWKHFYTVEFGPIPNLAIDAIVVPLAHWVPIVVSGKIFLTLLALVYVLGCYALGHVSGGRHWLALLAGMTVYNATLLWGFVNYLFGLGLCFLVFALWLHYRGTMTRRQFAILGGLSAVVYLAHLAAVAALGLACLSVAVMEGWRDPDPLRMRLLRLLRQVGWMVVPVLLLVFGFLGRNGRVGTISGFMPWHKLAALSTMVRSYNLRSDAGIALGLALCAVALLWRCRWRRELLAPGLALMAFCMVLPNRIFTSQNADIRISVPAFVLLVLSARPRWQRLQIAALCVAFALMVLHVALIARTWRQINHRADAVLAMGAHLPSGARVDVLEDVLFTGPFSNKWRFEVPKILDYWSVTRGAYESNVFARAGQQPLIKRAAFANCWPGKTPRCLANFDYLVTLDPPPWLRGQAQAAGIPVAHWRGDALRRLRRATAALPSPGRP